MSIVTLPIIVYFAYHNAIDDMLNEKISSTMSEIQTAIKSNWYRILNKSIRDLFKCFYGKLDIKLDSQIFSLELQINAATFRDYLLAKINKRI